MQIAKDKVVSIDYKLTGPQGQVLDSSEGRGPLTYMQGKGNIIPGLERQLEGKSAGDQVNVTVPAAEAYGERDERLVQSVPKSAFGEVQNIQPGMQFRANAPGGQSTVVTVTNVAPDQVTVDANHPLAGVPLTFDVKVVGVRDATTEEMQHGHTHGSDGQRSH
jgi:FKBP-type peptidyl-prolyl cis-trans isomerase SlyD